MPQRIQERENIPTLTAEVVDEQHTSENKKNGGNAGLAIAIIAVMGLIFAIVMIIIFLQFDHEPVDPPVVPTEQTETTSPVKTVVTVSQLQEILEISELSTAEYSYNSIARAYDEDGEKIRYYVYYEGTVKAGIDFSKIDILVDDQNMRIVLLLPDVEIYETYVDIHSLDYMFEKKKYETETISQEAYTLCTDDLKQKTENEEQFLEMAKDNAANCVKALIEPWVEQVNDEYVVTID